MRRVSLNARLAQDAQSLSDIHVALFEISHPGLAEPIRLSTDNTERLSKDPLYYGTRSSWRGANPFTEPYLWIIASTLLPSDIEDAPAAGTLIIENLDAGVASLVRSYTGLASISMAVVLASSPDLVEAEWTDMKIMSADINAGEITLSFSRAPDDDEYFPSGRMSRDRFPGLHR